MTPTYSFLTLLADIPKQRAVTPPVPAGDEMSSAAQAQVHRHVQLPGARVNDVSPISAALLSTLTNPSPVIEQKQEYDSKQQTSSADGESESSDPPASDNSSSSHTPYSTPQSPSHVCRGVNNSNNHPVNDNNVTTAPNTANNADSQLESNKEDRSSVHLDQQAEHIDEPFSNHIRNSLNHNLTMIQRKNMIKSMMINNLTMYPPHVTTHLEYIKYLLITRNQ